jgi:ferric-dicitrate binding protein FerR (iron transport regulator)
MDTKKHEITEALLLEFVGGTICETDKKIVEQWIEESPENEKTARQTASILHAMRTKERMEKRDPEIAFDKLLRKRRQKIRRVHLRRMATAAAVIALLISLGLNAFLYTGREQQETRYVTVQTNAGMRTNLNLPDGTLVHLNSASKLVYPIPYDPKERKVLLEGEGYFDVATNPDQPFVVSVADDRMRVNVLGTRFNINAYPNDEEVYTTLVEGSVVLQFTDADQSNAEKILDSNKEAIYSLNTRHIVIAEQKLVPDEKATHNLPTGQTTIRKVDTANEYAWKDGKLIFKDTPMPEVLNKLSNFYNVRFVVEDPVINNYPFTGTFDNKQLFQVLEYFKHTSKIIYTLHETAEDDSNGAKHTTVTLTR